LSTFGLCNIKWASNTELGYLTRDSQIDCRGFDFMWHSYSDDDISIHNYRKTEGCSRYKRDVKKWLIIGRREMEIVLIGYFLNNVCQIFSLGGFLTNVEIVQWFSAIQIGLITATIWVLMLNALIGFQWLDDGTLVSVGVPLLD